MQKCVFFCLFSLRITGTSSSEIREAYFSFIYLNICIHSDQRRDNFKAKRITHGNSLNVKHQGYR